ncbi:MAG: nicotinate-nucleotide adenylyltransferase [Saprospiraceae bacterium]|nr:nicotinate-nucleotide adenylyltransferase [Saprospiraceae bacterium]
MKVGLFFGSFNPVHVGHMIIADHIVQSTDVDQVWMVVSPHNPLKSKKSLAKDHDRLHLVKLAIGDNSRIKASSVEFGLPVPSYTIDTLTYLNEKYPSKSFSLIMGADNLETIEKWKNYTLILENYEIYLYQRPGYDGGKYTEFSNIHIVDAPLLDISATFIRDRIKAGKSVQYLVPDSVFNYLLHSNMYR